LRHTVFELRLNRHLFCYQKGAWRLGMEVVEKGIFARI
jgi:hypothetical protein